MKSKVSNALTSEEERQNLAAQNFFQNHPGVFRVNHGLEIFISTKDTETQIVFLLYWDFDIKSQKHRFLAFNDQGNIIALLPCYIIEPELCHFN